MTGVTPCPTPQGFSPSFQALALPSWRVTPTPLAAALPRLPPPLGVPAAVRVPPRDTPPSPSTDVACPALDSALADTPPNTPAVALPPEHPDETTAGTSRTDDAPLSLLSCSNLGSSTELGELLPELRGELRARRRVSARLALLRARPASTHRSPWVRSREHRRVNSPERRSVRSPSPRHPPRSLVQQS